MGTYRKIVVGVDGSETASKALRQAAALASDAGAELVVVSCYDSPSTSEMGKWQSESPAELTRRFSGREEADQILKGAHEMVTTDLPGIATKSRFEEGDPAETLIKVAEEEGADLLVVGSKGMSGVGRFLLGSVPNKVSHHAPCSVLIVKTT